MDKQNGEGWYEFVVMNNGELRIGEGHWFLSKSAQNVTSAGQVFINAEGKVEAVNDWSGHYQPNSNDAMNAAKIFQKNKLAAKNIVVVKSR